ncbi:MAG: type II toxin-antitoxin system Phd/YefM family antitoxin [Verrucomicrobiota bacterium]
MNITVVVTLNDAYAKLSALSNERARRVVELIEDLSELEAMENAADLAAAREVLAKPGEIISLDELEKRLGL